MSKRETAAQVRRRQIKEILAEAFIPVSAGRLAEELGVSRQIIVGDVALLRAEGLKVQATARGYLLEQREREFPYVGIVASRHSQEEMREELYTIVDYGGTVIDVSIQHAIYGELVGQLNLTSRFDVDRFMEKVEREKNSAPISSLTGGLHLHRIGYSDPEAFEFIRHRLKEEGFSPEED